MRYVRAFLEVMRAVSRVSVVALPFLLAGCGNERDTAPVESAGAALVSAPAEIVFLIDASAAISDDELATQASALAETLGDATAIPRNGSYAVSVFQFADVLAPGGNHVATQREWPLTVLDSEQAANDVIAALQNLDRFQIGDFLGLTNPGSGIIAAQGELDFSGDPAKLQAMCLSVGGRRLDGLTLSDALALTQTRPNPVDRLGILALGDAEFPEHEAESEYAEHVFGGGLFSYVTTPTEYKDRFAETCIPPAEIDETGEVALVGLEAVQVSQTWTNSVSLIEGKDTFVRAHVEVDGATQTFASVVLVGSRDGSELGTLEPLHGSLLVQPDAVSRRGELFGSFLFQLPEGWLSGDVELEVQGSALTCREAANTPEDCALTAHFEATGVPQVTFLGVDYVDEFGVRRQVTEGVARELAERLRSIYPVKEVAWIFEPFAYGQPVGTEEIETLRSAVEAKVAMDGCTMESGCTRLHYGAFDRPAFGIGGLAPLGGLVSVGKVTANPERYGRFTHAHELGHLLGRPHATPVVNPSSQPPRFSDPCGSSDSSEGFPHEEIVDGTLRVTIGPFEPEGEVVYGFDTLRKRVVDPRQHFELLSYCGSDRDEVAPVIPSVWRWISDYTYERLHTAIVERFGTVQASSHSFELAAFIAPERFLLFRGGIDRVTDEVELLSVLTTTSATLVSPTSGDYRLELYDSSDTLLSSIPFQPQEDVVEDGASPSASFIVPVLYDAAIAQAKVLFGGQVVAVASGTPAPPSVELIAPNGGEELTPGAVTVSWMGNDPDGDSLDYSVQYSADGGLSWQTLAVQTTTTELTLDTASLTGTSSAKFRVLATDGFHTAFDESDGVFTTPGSPPSATIRFPQDGDRFTGNPIVIFDAVAIDREDGRLDGESVVWWSSLDGELGTGARLELAANTLSPGQHTISVAASDSSGGVAGDSVVIFIERQASPGDVPRAELHAAEHIEIRDTTDIDVASILAGGHLLVGNGSQITADITALGDASFGLGTTVRGDVTLGGQLLSADTGFLDGSLAVGVDLSGVATDIPGKAVLAGTENVLVRRSTTASLPPGAYAEVHVQGKGTLRLTEGSYDLSTLVLDPNAKLVVDGSSEKVEVNLSGKPQFGNRAEIEAPGPSSLRFYSNSVDPIRIGHDVRFVGTIVAPQAEVRVSSHALGTLRAAARRLVVFDGAILD